MARNAYFQLSIKQQKGELITGRKKIFASAIKMFNSYCNIFNEEGYTETGCSMDYNEEAVLCRLSKHFSSVVLELHVKEYDGTRYKVYACDGKIQVCTSKLVFERFNSRKLK